MAGMHILSGSAFAPHDVVVRKIDAHDIWASLRDGAADFYAAPSHLLFIGMIYPLAGICLGALTFSANALPLLYPLVSGFALVAPFAAVALYEISRRREAGRDARLGKAFEVLRSPSMPAIVVLGLILMALLLAWLATAQSLYQSLFGLAAPPSYSAFLSEIMTTDEGRRLILVGNGLGFLFALVAFTISAVSFPLLVDRDVGLAVAVMASVRVVLKNPLTMALWALVIVAVLVVASLPLLVGLTIAVPVLAHATWRLYRRAIEPDFRDANPMAE